MDSDLWIQILELVVLLTLSGFFSSAETAMVSVSKIRLRTLEEGNKKAALALKILENQSKMLSALLIGNNLVNTSAASIASVIAYSFGGAAVSIATFIITFLILVFGEITPKTWATINADKLALAYAPIILLLMKVLTPVIWFVNLFSSGILKLMGIQNSNKNISMTESELRTIVDVSHEEGVIEEDEKDMINKVFDLGDAKAKDVMVPRVHVVMAEIDSTYKDLLEIFREEKFTRIPIYQDKIDNIVGVVNMKDLLMYDDFSHFDMQKILRKPKFTYENKKVSELLIEMKQSTFNLAIVMDEYGEFSGIVTLEDIIEEIVGDVQDEYDAHEEENIIKLNNQTYDVKGYLSLHDLNDYLDLDLDSEDFDSVGGLVIDALGRLPQTNDETTLPNGIRIKVLKVEKNRIESVRLILPDIQNEKDA
ncbi:HlyC/CorC family transporter [Holdemanella biformis]|uniref:HlyC/CorC family transporter n=1 Tax=Holdemanella biformis TaxID=1735 RepID=UPI004029C349